LRIGSRRCSTSRRSASSANLALQLPALQQWSFSQDQARRIVQPVLAVIGERTPESGPIWQERQQLLLSWLPNVEPFVLPRATHLLHIENPHDMAEGLAGFFDRHPLKVSA